MNKADLTERLSTPINFIVVVVAGVITIPSTLIFIVILGKRKVSDNSDWQYIKLLERLGEGSSININYRRCICDKKDGEEVKPFIGHSRIHRLGY